MGILILFLLILAFLLIYIYSKQDFLLTMGILSIVNLYFPQYISIGGLQISTLLNLFSFFYCLRFLGTHRNMPVLYRKELHIVYIFLGLLLLWGILNGTVLSSPTISGYKRAVFQFAVATYIFFIVKTKEQIHTVWVCLIIFFYILTSYGIYSYLTQTNNVLLALNLTFNQSNEILNSFSLESRGGLEGRIQGFTTHPLEYGGVLIVGFFYLLHSFLLWNTFRQRIVAIPVMFLISINIFLCGSRSAMVAFIIGVILVAFIYNKKKQLIIIGLSIYVGLLIISKTQILSQYNDYINSFIFFWEDQDTVKGSGFNLRIEQLEATFDLISENIISFLFGKGDQWCNNYSMVHGEPHPKLYGFESIIFIGLIEYGILGFIMLKIGLYFHLFKLAHQYNLKHISMVTIVSFFIFQVFTGGYSWLPFLVFLMIMIKTDTILKQ